MEEARIKMVGDQSWAKENVVTGILRLVRENGLFSTFGGLPAMLSKQVMIVRYGTAAPLFRCYSILLFKFIAHSSLNLSKRSPASSPLPPSFMIEGTVLIDACFV